MLENIASEVIHEITFAELCKNDQVLFSEWKKTCISS